MRFIAGWLVLLAALVCPASGAASSDVLPGYLASSWEKLNSTLTSVMNLQEKQEALPESAYFGPDKSSNAKKINALLDQALEILLQGDANELRKQAIALRLEVPRLRLEKDALQNKRIAAPEASRLPWVQTREAIDERSAELEKQIEEKDLALKEIDAKLSTALREMGLDLNEAQISTLLTSVTGDDLLQNAVIFGNVRRVVEKLAELSRENRDDLEISRRYFGMYLVLNDLLIYTQEGLVEKVEVSYKPRLEAVRADAEKLRKEALERAAQPQYTEAQKKSFAMNAESNAMTIGVTTLYGELLEKQRKTALATLAGLRRNRDLVDNTYKTVRSSADLRNLIRSGLELFDATQTLSMPEIQPFENDAIRKEFEEINRRIQ